MAVGTGFISSRSGAGADQRLSLGGNFRRALDHAEWRHGSAFLVVRGLQAQCSYNFGPHFGVTADFGGQYPNISGSRLSQYEYLFGPRFTARASRATLFAHTLVGANTLHASGSSLNGFAWGVGGGLDYNVNHHIAIGAIQADYLRTRLSNT